MKKIILSIVLFLLADNSFAQTSYYKGEWTVWDKSSLFTCFCKVDIAKDGIVRAEFIWTYVSTDSSNAYLVTYYKGKKGSTGIEYTEGRYTASTGDIYLQTESMGDPAQILGESRYYLKLSADKQVLYGTTTDPEDKDPGLFCATRQNAAAASEFNSLKSRSKPQ